MPSNRTILELKDPDSWTQSASGRSLDQERRPGVRQLGLQFQQQRILDSQGSAQNSKQTSEDPTDERDDCVTFGHYAVWSTCVDLVIPEVLSPLR
jgi:hypothetical protein